MKKFDLEAAKKGAEVVTRGKKPVKMLHYTRDNPRFPLVAIIDNKDVACFTAEGKFFDDANHKQSKNDLFLK